MTAQFPALAAVALGGAMGAMLRYGVAQFYARPGDASLFAALLVNVLGCLLAGFASVALEARFGEMVWLKPLLIVGFAGGLTTFSAFGLDLAGLLQAQRVGLAAGMAAAHLILGLGAVFVGIGSALAIFERV